MEKRVVGRTTGRRQEKTAVSLGGRSGAVLNGQTGPSGQSPWVEIAHVGKYLRMIDFIF